MMTFPTISAGTRANEAIGGYDDFVEYLNALSTAVDANTTSATGAALKANNLSDLTDAAAARTALGLGTAATANTGTGAANVILGNDSRLTDTRTPTTHAHAQSDVTDLVSTLVARSIPMAVPVGGYSNAHCMPLYDQVSPIESDGRFDIWPYHFAHAMTIDELTIRVSTAASAGVWRLGFYLLDGAQGQPYTRLADLGTVDPTGSTGDRTITGLSVTLPKGWVGFGIVPQSSSSGGAYRASYPTGGINFGSAFNPNMNAWQQQSITGALPATVTTAAIAGYRGPNFSIHRSA
jgi:hypothetical protein